MKTQHVHLFVLDTLSDWEIGYASTAIHNPAFQKAPGRYAIQTVGLTRNPVTTMGGLRILPDLALAEVDPAQSALLILTGGMTWDQGLNTEAVQKAQEFLAAGKPVAAICGATAALARAGLLDRVRHTSNAKEYLQATGYAGTALYQNLPAVTDGLVITAAGTAPLEFAYQIFKTLDLFQPDTLAAWFGLFKTGEPTYFHTLMKALEQPA